MNVWLFNSLQKSGGLYFFSGKINKHFLFLFMSFEKIQKEYFNGVSGTVFLDRHSSYGFFVSSRVILISMAEIAHGGKSTAELLILFCVSVCLAVSPSLTRSIFLCYNFYFH